MALHRNNPQSLGWYLASHVRQADVKLKNASFISNPIARIILGIVLFVQTMETCFGDHLLLGTCKTIAALLTVIPPTCKYKTSTFKLSAVYRNVRGNILSGRLGCNFTFLLGETEDGNSTEGNASVFVFKSVFLIRTGHRKVGIKCTTQTPASK